ncbi:hypothetical protein H696_00495 [Fonticula alba]|uniref:Uncharacterized protein n=1 Tax=Fonticula alba TaxID=691883 RepID=A0A058ZHH4_FONAL|nr:hypothetical protein H696_00495 [Fonticula alba]KCV72932.1 hypothetical protein H696_00495 [Fonticula alba]|eukprot:XP_009492633.1 hypothetical protein H696_00495 [Fonticula alba]
MQAYLESPGDAGTEPLAGSSPHAAFDQTALTAGSPAIDDQSDDESSPSADGSIGPLTDDMRAARMQKGQCMYCGKHSATLPCMRLVRRGVPPLQAFRPPSLQDHARQQRDRALNRLCMICGGHPNNVQCMQMLRMGRVLDLTTGRYSLTQEERNRRTASGLCSYCGVHPSSAPCPTRPAHVQNGLDPMSAPTAVSLTASGAAGAQVAVSDPSMQPAGQSPAALAPASSQQSGQRRHRGPLSAEERERRIKAGLCLYCAEHSSYVPCQQRPLSKFPAAGGQPRNAGAPRPPAPHILQHPRGAQGNAYHGTMPGAGFPAGGGMPLAPQAAYGLAYQADGVPQGGMASGRPGPRHPGARPRAPHHHSVTGAGVSMSATAATPTGGSE